MVTIDISPADIQWPKSTARFERVPREDPLTIRYECQSEAPEEAWIKILAIEGAIRVSVTEERYDPEPEFPRVHWSSGSIADESEALALLEQVSSAYCRDRTAFWDSRTESLDYTAVAYDVVDYRLLDTEELEAQFTADGSCVARGLSDEERAAVEDETHVLYWEDDGSIGVKRAIQTLPDVETVRPPRDEPREMDTWGPGTLVAEAYAVRQWIAISPFAEHTQARQLGAMLKRLLQEYDIPPVAFKDESAYEIAAERGYFN